MNITQDFKYNPYKEDIMKFKEGDKFILADWMKDEEDPISLGSYTIEEIDNTEVTISWIEEDGSKDDTTYLIEEVTEYIDKGHWILIK